MNNTPSLPSKLVLRNDAALFPWAIAIFYWFGIAVVTWLIVRDGLPPNLNPAFSKGMMMFFWMGAIGLAFWASGLRRIHVEVDQGQGRLVQSGLFKQEAIAFTQRDVTQLEVVESTDSDGDPYFSCVLALNDGQGIRVVEGHDRRTVESAVWRLRKALGMES